MNTDAKELRDHMRSLPPKIRVTTFINGTAAYAVDDNDILIASHDCGSAKKSLTSLVNSLRQIDSETHWKPRYEISHEQLLGQ